MVQQPVVQQPEEDQEPPEKKILMDTMINLVQQNIQEVSSMYVTNEPGNLSVNVTFKP